MPPLDSWQRRAVTADEAARSVASGSRVFLHGAAATPGPLVEALVRRTDLGGVELFHLHTAGDAPFCEPEHRGRFRSVSLFAGAPVRAAIAAATPSSSRSSCPTFRRRSRRGRSRPTCAAAALAARSPRLLHARHLG